MQPIWPRVIREILPFDPASWRCGSRKWRASTSLRAFGVCDVGQEGAYAEKIAIKAAIVAKKVDRLSHVDAAALALAGLTAICAIEDTLKLKAGHAETHPSCGFEKLGGFASSAERL